MNGIGAKELCSLRKVDSRGQLKSILDSCGLSWTTVACLPQFAFLILLLQDKMSHKKCSVLGCEANDGKMFKFPKKAADEARFQNWVSATEDPLLLTLPKHKILSRTICCKHFEKRYILQHKLSTSAVPTLFLPDKATHKKCSVLGCKANNGKMFKFPKKAADEARFQKWVSAAGNPLLLTLPKEKITTRTVCCKHFEKRYFLQHKLSTSAVPTLFLPEPISVTSKKEHDGNKTE